MGVITKLIGSANQFLEKNELVIASATFVAITAVIGSRIFANIQKSPSTSSSSIATPPIKFEQISSKKNVPNKITGLVWFASRFKFQQTQPKTTPPLEEMLRDFAEMWPDAVKNSEKE